MIRTPFYLAIGSFAYSKEYTNLPTKIINPRIAAIFGDQIPAIAIFTTFIGTDSAQFIWIL